MMLQTVVAVETEVATVSAVPMAPFISIRDGSIDAVALNKLASFGRRAAYANGWIAGLNSTFRSNTTAAASGADDASGSGDSRGWSITNTGGRTVFLVAQLVVIDSNSTYVPTRVEEVCTVVCRLAACGTSSYTVRTDVMIAQSDAQPRRLGYAVQTFVNVDMASRKPVAIAEDAKQRALAALQRQEKTEQGGEATLQRIARPTPGEVREPHHSFTSTVRPYADFDFNGHVNQGIYVSLALDALYALARSETRPSTCPTELIEALRGNSSRRGEIHVKSVRVDYLNEVADVEATLRADIFWMHTNGTDVTVRFEVVSAADSAAKAHGTIVVLSSSTPRP